MGKKKGLLSKVGRFVVKLPRETFRIIDQGLGLGNKAIEKTGLDKLVSGGGSVGVATTSGAHGGSNVHYRPAGSTNSIGIGISNAGNASLFVSNQAAVSLTTPTANFIEKAPERITITPEVIDHKAQPINNRIAERDQLLKDTYGPGYIPESSLATMGIVALGTATKQFLQDNLQAANAVADIYLDTYVNIYSANDTQRAEAWNRNQELVINVTQTISNVVENPQIIPTYYYNKFQEASGSFAAAYDAGNLMSAGNAAGHVVYDAYIISAATAGANALTSKVVSNFKPPMTIQFNGPHKKAVVPLNTNTQLKPPVQPAKLTKSRITEFLQQVDQMPVEELIQNLEKLNFKLLHASPEEGIYKFCHIKNEMRGTGKAKANLESSKVMVEVHFDAKSGSHMHITDANGNVYDKDLNNLNAKYRKDNPGWHENKIQDKAEKSPEAHIKIKEFVKLNIRLGNV